MDKSGIQVSLTLPPAEQYQPAPMVNIQGDTPEMFEEYLAKAATISLLTPFFASYDDSVGKLTKTTAPAAVARVQAVFHNDPLPTPAGAAAGPGPAVAAAPEVATVVTGGPADTTGPLGVGSVCPNMPHETGRGTGKLEQKTRKDKKGTFVGCDSYPNCNYILR